ncbi:thioredoxin family protein [Haloferula sp. A504]|uniref:thioredoxin family protein n=1 Tax=Haloferula sp. A504 TaxID=3373601 RepID=UPI0031C0374B|nr:thioredoxin family protein [Verrucomicrobiaceae bacterium E54]
MKRSLLILLPLAFAGCDPLKDKLSGSGSGSESIETLSLHATDLAEGEIDAFVNRRNQVVVLDFHATWCGPCKTLAPKLEKIAAEFGDKVALGKVDVDQANAAAARFGVSGIPDVRIFVNGTQVDRFTGDMPEAHVRAKIVPHTTSVSGQVEAGPAGSPAANDGPAIQPMEKDWLPPGMQRQ